MPTTESWFEELPCHLSAHEKLLKSESLAERLKDVHVAEAEKKDAMEEFKLRLGGLEKQIDKLALEVRTGREYREVECFESASYSDNKVDIVRKDTGEVVRSRAMHPNERQEKMPFVDVHGEPATCEPAKQLPAKTDSEDDDGDEFQRSLQ
jgi:hypothetical protein